MFKNQLASETNANLNKWLLFDSASTTHLISNNKLVHNIRPNGKSQGVISNGG